MQEHIRILHLEDNDADAELIKTMLEHGGIQAEIKQVRSKETYVEEVENQDYDLVISDYSIPQFDGIKALIEAKRKNKYIPFIFCSGTIGEERAVQCLQLGAMDYVLKERLDRLVPAVNRAMRLVTEIKKKEKAENELAKIKLAVENTGEAIFVTDPNEIILYINPSFTKMYGWEPDEVVGKHTPGILKSDKHDESFFQEFSENLKKRKPFSVELINKKKDGELIEIRNMVSPVIDKKNNLTGYVAIQTDISLRKMQERELIRAKHEAEEMSKLKSYFLSNISHEMRTPLISILGFSELLLDELENKEHKEAAKYIYESGNRLKTTINSILSLENIEKDKIEINTRKFNLIKLLNEITGNFKKAAEKKNLVLEKQFENEEVWLNSDASLLGKAFNNILDNAVKFTKNGTVSISVSTYKEDNLQFALVKIADSGVGISEDKLKQVYNPFRQESEGLDRSYEGMGLGLYITKQTLELLNGNINIESKIGEGTQVEVTLPVLPMEEEIIEKIEQQKSEAAEPKETYEAYRPKVLLVEDNEGNRLVFNRYLRDDFVVDNAEEGVTAISKAELKQYDMILMDINLGPGIDGIETFRRIRELPGYKDIPVIAITAYAMKSDKEKFLNYGFTDYLKKPVLKDELLSSLKKL